MSTRPTQAAQLQSPPSNSSNAGSTRGNGATPCKCVALGYPPGTPGGSPRRGRGRSVLKVWPRAPPQARAGHAVPETVQHLLSMTNPCAEQQEHETGPGFNWKIVQDRDSTGVKGFGNNTGKSSVLLTPGYGKLFNEQKQNK